MSVRRRAIQERKLRDGMRRKQYEEQQRWMGNVRALLERKLLRVSLGDEPTVSLEELAACFNDATTSDKSPARKERLGE